MEPEPAVEHVIVTFVAADLSPGGFVAVTETGPLYISPYGLHVTVPFESRITGWDTMVFSVCAVSLTQTPDDVAHTQVQPAPQFEPTS